MEELSQKPGRPKLFGIRLGFRLVSGLRQIGIESMSTERENKGLFKNFEEFIARNRLFKDDYIKRFFQSLINSKINFNYYYEMINADNKLKKKLKLFN